MVYSDFQRTGSGCCFVSVFAELLIVLLFQFGQRIERVEACVITAAVAAQRDDQLKEFGCRRQEVFAVTAFDQLSVEILDADLGHVFDGFFGHAVEQPPEPCVA